MKTDTHLQHDVQTELEWEPSVDDSQIGVTANPFLDGEGRSREGRLGGARSIRSGEQPHGDAVAMALRELGQRKRNYGPAEGKGSR